MAERYITPEQGTVDWHLPLNDNFTRLNRDVEIRDLDANRGSYDPRAGAKFLATDTGAVYIGDGGRWSLLGSISGTSGGSSDGKRMADGTLVARPGDVQATIDEASSSGTYADAPAQRVRLQSGKTYQVGSTIKVRRNVILDCNGARVEPTADVDIFHLYRGTKLVDPFIDCQAMSSWGSRAIVLGPSDAGKLGTNNRAWVENAYLNGNKGRGSGSGIVFYGGGNPCSMQHASGDILGFENAVHFHADGGDTSGSGNWSNGNSFVGNVQHPVYAYRLQSEGAAVGGNMARGQVQPKGGVTEWSIYIDDDPRDPATTNFTDNNYVRRGNSFFLYNWDWNKVTNSYHSKGDRRAPAFYVGRGQTSKNTLVDLGGRWGNQFMVNNSDVRANENGISALHGWDVRGTEDFSTKSAFRRQSSRNYHSGGRN